MLSLTDLRKQNDTWKPDLRIDCVEENFMLRPERVVQCSRDAVILVLKIHPICPFQQTSKVSDLISSVLKRAQLSTLTLRVEMMMMMIKVAQVKLYKTVDPE